MVQLDDSRRYATNYFRLMSDSLAANKANKAGTAKEAPWKVDDIDYASQSTPYQKNVEQLTQHYQDKIIPQIAFELHSGFNIQLYGYGRKYLFLEIIRKVLNSENAIIIDAYDPMLTLNSVYSTLLNAGLDLRKNLGHCDYVLIYGLDSHRLRNELFYKNLANAASSGLLRLVATVEDPSFSLLLSPSIVDQFNFVHHDFTTFLPYGENELESLPEIASSKSSNKRSIKGALFVLQSLTPNARAIFKLLAEHQLANQAKESIAADSDSEESDQEGDVCQNGLAQLDLFKLCQSKFLISSEQAFKIILTEFLDHEVIKVARSNLNGAEVLRIPFSPVNIKDILTILSTM